MRGRRLPALSNCSGLGKAASRYDPIPPMLALADAGVDFVVIGGIAAQTHGSARVTIDLDVMCERSDENLTRLIRALAELDAKLHGAPPDIPFPLDERTLKGGGNFTLSTAYGPVDILAYPAGARPYDRLRADAVVQDVEGRSIRFAAPDDLIAMKKAAAREKDLGDLRELQALADELNRSEREDR